MFGMGWGELMIVGIVALIVVGPEDLPQLFRSVGRFTGKARGMAREFSKAMNDAADQAGVNEINRTIRAASNPSKFGTDSLKSAAGLGPKTSRLSEERAEAKRKISETAALKAEERKARERDVAETEAEIADDEAASRFAGNGGADRARGAAAPDHAPDPGPAAEPGAETTPEPTPEPAARGEGRT